MIESVNERSDDHVKMDYFDPGDVLEMCIEDLGNEILRRYLKILLISLDDYKKRKKNDVDFNDVFHASHVNINTITKSMLGNVDVIRYKDVIGACKAAVKWLNERGDFTDGVRLRLTKDGIATFARMLREGEIFIPGECTMSMITGALENYTVKKGFHLNGDVPVLKDEHAVIREMVRGEMMSMPYFSSSEVKEMEHRVLLEEMIRRWIVAIHASQKEDGIDEMFTKPVVSKHGMARAIVKNPRGKVMKAVGSKIVKTWNRAADEGTFKMVDFVPIFDTGAMDIFDASIKDVYLSRHFSREIERSRRKFDTLQRRADDLVDQRVEPPPESTVDPVPPAAYHELDDLGDGSVIGDRLLEMDEVSIDTPARGGKEPGKRFVDVDALKEIVGKEPSTVISEKLKERDDKINHLTNLLGELNGKLSMMDARMKHVENMTKPRESRNIVEFFTAPEDEKTKHLVFMDLSNVVETARREILHFNFSTMMYRVLGLITSHDNEVRMENMEGWIFCTPYYKKHLEKFKKIQKKGDTVGKFCKRFHWRVIAIPKRSNETGLQDIDLWLGVQAVAKMAEYKDTIRTVTIVAGDGDYMPVIEIANRWQLHTHVISFESALSGHLVDLADHVSCFFS